MTIQRPPIQRPQRTQNIHSVTQFIVTPFPFVSGSKWFQIPMDSVYSLRNHGQVGSAEPVPVIETGSGCRR